MMDKRHFYHNINAATDFNYFKDTFPKVCVRPACMCKIISGADLSDIDQAIFFYLKDSSDCFDLNRD